MERILEKIRNFLSHTYQISSPRFDAFMQAIGIWHDSRLHNLNRRTLVILFIGVLLASAVYIEGFKSPEGFPTDQYITIGEGSSLTSLAKEFEELNIVRNASLLKVVVFLRGGQRSVDAGDYLFAKPVGIFAVARIITTGTYGLEPIRITIPEGATVADMAIIYGKRLFKFDPENFFVGAIKYEGFLYPDTYYFLPNVREDEVIAVMRDNFNKRIAPYVQDIEESKYTLREIIILASIIEKEAWKEEDRKLISGVLHNRLDADMLLQVDATFTYTHGKGTYQITLAELSDKENLYNTYVYKGLPPGPIAAVGGSSIEAALNPTQNDYIFYLADRKGNTYYSTTYVQHLAKKRRYVDR